MVYPSQILNLTNWALMLPTGKVGKPEMVRVLANYEHPAYFHANHFNSAVAFIANAGGVNSIGSQYARSELRELIDGVNAAWSMNEGTHQMTATESIHVLPPIRPQVVVAQIHDYDGGLLAVRLTANTLYVQTKVGKFILEPNYTLGTEFTVRILAANSMIQVFYNDTSEPQVTVSSTSERNYFKIGAYIQSNVAKGEDPDAYSEVWVRSLDVKHW
jgi:Alginate lyase